MGCRLSRCESGEGCGRCVLGHSLMLTLSCLCVVAGWCDYASAGECRVFFWSCPVREHVYWPARLSVPLGPMVVALDFDGVCLDSEPEASRVAWRTACELWPWLTEECRLTERVMDESAYVDRRRLGGQPLCGTAEDAMPLWLRAKMRLLRPVMRDDADALLLVRLCMAEVVGSDDPRKRPLTVGEISSNWDEALRETLQARYDLSAADAMTACEATREAWAREEAEEWVGAHQQYPAALDRLREAVRPSLLSKPTVYILTARRDSAHVEQLLRRHGVSLPAEHILLCAAEGGEAADGVLGGASGGAAPSKAAALATLRERHGEALLRYVDDDASCLRAVAAEPRLFAVQLFFASWGYSTEAQRSQVAAMPRVRELFSSRDLEGVLDMPRRDGTQIRL